VCFAADPLHPKFKQWLESIGAGSSFEAFVNAGYDISFIAEHGLTDEDLDCVGIDRRKLGIRRKLRALHNIREFISAAGTGVIRIARSWWEGDGLSLCMICRRRPGRRRR
jgi:hypothetical protein